MRDSGPSGPGVSGRVRVKRPRTRHPATVAVVRAALAEGAAAGSSGEVQIRHDGRVIGGRRALTGLAIHVGVSDLPGEGLAGEH